jgi:FtsZ-interacting cell division protein ZipA
LDGTLCDETRSSLTPQSVNHLRERIAEFARRQLLKA